MKLGNNGFTYSSHSRHELFPNDIYMFKAQDESARTTCEICSKLTIKTPEQRQPFPGINYLPCSTSHQANLSCVLLISEIFITFLANAPFQYIMETSLNKEHQTLPEKRSGRLLLYDQVRIHASIIINLTMGDSEVSLNMHLSEDWPHIHSFFL